MTAVKKAKKKKLDELHDIYIQIYTVALVILKGDLKTYLSIITSMMKCHFFICSK